jgi:hypothetical protein
LRISRPRASSSPCSATSARRIEPPWQMTSAGSAAGSARIARRPSATRARCSA